MAEPHVLISREKYQQLLPNNPLPSQAFQITTPPPGIPKSDSLTDEANVIKVDNKSGKKQDFIYDNPVYSESSESEGDEEEDIGGSKKDSADWSKSWKTI